MYNVIAVKHSLKMQFMHKTSSQSILQLIFKIKSVSQSYTNDCNLFFQEEGGHIKKLKRFHTIMKKKKNGSIKQISIHVLKII